MSEIFLIGHKGFVGSHLLPRLLNDGHTITTDFRYWERRYDVIINLAAVTHTRNEFDPELIHSNFILPERVFDRPERVVYASSCSAAYLTSPYSLSKMWAEYLGGKHGNAVGLRFFNLYGSKNNKGVVWFLMNQPTGSKITIRGPSLLRDYLHVNDAVEEIIKNLHREDRVVNYKDMTETVTPHVGVKEVGSGIGTETMDLVNLYMKLSGKTFDISVIDPHPSEPPEMVAKYPTLCLSLEEGLLKTINNE